MTITELPKIEITEDERIWLQECWNHLIEHDKLNVYKQIKIRTRELISNGFKPWEIDDRLISGNVKITIQGLIAIGLEEKVFAIGNKMFAYIRNELFEDADKDKFDLNHIADCIEESRKWSRIIFNLFTEERLDLWDGAGSNSDDYGYERIDIRDRAFDTYINNESMTDVFLLKIREINKYKNKVEEIHNTLDLQIDRIPEFRKPLFPLEIIENTRGYVENIGKQACACYDSGFYDASIVMIRKLLETLIIECFEHHEISDMIINKDGHFYYLGDLINMFTNETKWKLSRNTKSALPKIKKLGDLSAHNRRFSAKQADLDKISDDLRIVIEELTHLNKYNN